MKRRTIFQSLAALFLGRRVVKSASEPPSDVTNFLLSDAAKKPYIPEMYLGEPVWINHYDTIKHRKYQP